MGRLWISMTFILAFWRFPVTYTQDNEIDITLTRGTTGLGIQLVSEARGAGAVVDRVVPDSAASLVLRAGDILTKVAGVDINKWSLDNINRLLGVYDRVKLRVRRPPEPRQLSSGPSDGDKEAGGQPTTASCYASIEGNTDDLHAFPCTPTALGTDLPPFYVEGSTFAFPVVIAQPLEYCTNDGLLLGGKALVVSKGGCLPGVKARNAAKNQAEVVILIDGQFPPFPPLPSAAGGKTLLPSTISAQSQARKVDIPVIIINNSTGQRLISEVRDHGREVMVLAHAGLHPSRWTATPRKQIPLDESESLDVAEEAFNLKASFRDGQVLLDFGTPGPPSGKSPTLYLQVPYELPSLISGGTKKIAFERRVQCPVCDGRGAPAADMRPCKVCSSSDQPGISSVEHEHSSEVEQTLRTTCSHCHGFGEVAKKGKSCPRCKGERTIIERASLDLQIPKGAPERHTLHFPGIGSHLVGREAGDVEVVLQSQPHERFTRDGANLRTGINITLTEALSGFLRDIPLLNGTMVALNRTGMTSNQGEIEIEGGGLPMWDPAKREDVGAASFVNTSAPPQEEELGSLIITCTVVFPGILGGGQGRLKGGENFRTSDAT